MSTLSPHSLSSFAEPLSPSIINPRSHIIILRFHLHRSSYPRLQSSRRISNYPQEWNRKQGLAVEGYDDGDEDGDEEEEEEEEEEDRSLDLLVRFVQNVFRKVSRKSRKAVRSILPLTIPTKLVGFSVNGVIVLAFLWVLKAFLEVVCTLGSVVFVSILLIRGIWFGLSYLQQSRNHRANEFDDDHHAWTGAQPAS